MISTTRPTASRLVLSIVLLVELRAGQEVRGARLEGVVNRQTGPWRNNIALKRSIATISETLIV